MSTLILPSIAEAIANATHSARAPLRWNPAEHLLSRFAFGPTKTDRAYLAKYGPTAWYSLQISRGRLHPGYSANSSVAAVGPLLSKSPAQLHSYFTAQGKSFSSDAMNQLGMVTIGLQAWSPAQLYETLVDFFANHLNVSNHVGDLWLTRHAYDRDVIRKYAFGSFTDMLLASARNPAMLRYLNLSQSTDKAINENYGRELLELHTVGLNYTESDVVNAATLLTGRAIDSLYRYAYNPAVHPIGQVQVLGFTTPNATSTAGETEGDDLLRYLAAHPFTAQHLARKLCLRFVSDSPSAALVNAVAAAYLSHHTQILPMVSTILRSTEFWASRGAKVRRPAENLVATVRVLGLGVSDWSSALGSLTWMAHLLGDRPLDWQPPNGYPDVATAWRSSGTLMNLWHQHLSLLGGSWSGMKPVTPSSYFGTPKTSGAAIAALTHTLTRTTWTTTHLAVLQAFLGEPATTPMTRSTLRWKGRALMAIILDGPHHALR